MLVNSTALGKPAPSALGEITTLQVPAPQPGEAATALPGAQHVRGSRRGKAAHSVQVLSAHLTAWKTGKHRQLPADSSKRGAQEAESLTTLVLQSGVFTLSLSRANSEE